MKYHCSVFQISIKNVPFVEKFEHWNLLARRCIKLPITTGKHIGLHFDFQCFIDSRLSKLSKVKEVFSQFETHFHVKKMYKV